MSGVRAKKYQKLDDSIEDGFESLIGGEPVSPEWHTPSDIGDGDVASRLSWQTPEIKYQDEGRSRGFRSGENHELSTYKSSQESKGRNVKIAEPTSLVLWGIGWRKPSLMVLLLVLGVASAVGHHFYYKHMAGTVTSDPARQQWTIWIGTGFTFLVCFFLNSANGIAFTQYIWIVVKDNGITVDGVDKLFGLTGDIKGFLSLELWNHAKIGIVMAFGIWSLALTSVVPPGTISVIPSLQNVTNLTNVDTLDWEYVKRYNGYGLLIYESMGGDNGWNIAYPRSALQRLASIVSQTGAVAYVSPPASNSSYKIQFYGPALSCNLATDSAQSAFNYYTQRTLNETQMITSQQSAASFKYGNSHLIVWSAFSPQLYGYISIIPGNPNPDHYNNWKAELPADTPTQWSDLTSGAQLWVQLSNSSVVCQLTNASYNVGFDYPNGAQVITSRTVEYVNTWNSSILDSDGYLAFMASVNSMLYGNVTLLPNQCDADANGTTTPPFYACLQQDGQASQVLLTSIAACPEIQNNSWLHDLKMVGTNPMEAQSASSCRNGSVLKALEDLAANITTSMLNLNIQNHFEPVNLLTKVTYYSSNNIYDYDAEKLIISYGSGVLATLIIVAIGFVAFVINGVSYDSSFSAIMTTTRNPELDIITVGHSLGQPSKDLKKTKLRFGGVADEARKVGVERAAFGLLKNVSDLKKGGDYI